MPTTTITSYEPGFQSSKMMGRKYHSCLQKAKELNGPSLESRTNGENAGMTFDALGCAFGGVSMVGSIMSSAKESQSQNQKLQIHLYNRSPYVIIPQRVNFSGVTITGDAYRTVSIPGPLKPGEQGEFEIDCDKEIRKDKAFDGSEVAVVLSVVSLAGRAICGYTKWKNTGGVYYLPMSSTYGPEDYLHENLKEFLPFTTGMSRYKQNLYLQSVTTEDKAYPQFAVATTSSPIGQDDNENTHLNLEIVPWEINPEAFVEDETLVLGNTSEVKNIGSYMGGLKEYAVPIGSKIWKQVLRDNADNNPSNTRGVVSAVVPFGNMAQAGAKMVAGLISGARGLTRFQKAKVPINVNVKNMTACTMTIAKFNNCTNGYLESSMIPPGEDGNFLLTDDLVNANHAQVSFFFSPDDEEDSDSHIVCEWENKAGMCQMWKVKCWNDNEEGSEAESHGRNADSSNHQWNVESIYFQVPTPKSSNIIVCCTMANNKAEQDLTLTFAQ